MEALHALLFGRVDLSSYSLWTCVVCIVLVPVWWNVTARLEYRTKALTRLFCGHRYLAAYALALAIFLASSLRTWLFHSALQSQPRFVLGGAADAWALDLLAYVIILSGGLLVAGAYYRLGIVNTYLGDYFGILMAERVTGFPFNIMEDPMYNGSSMLYLADALLARSWTGLGLSALVFWTYSIASHFFEGPFTSYIYSEAAKKAEQKRVKQR
jgi:methylene-fatty-acyl-phospholipid synthase